MGQLDMDQSEIGQPDFMFCGLCHKRFHSIQNLQYHKLRKSECIPAADLNLPCYLCETSGFFHVKMVIFGAKIARAQQEGPAGGFRGIPRIPTSQQLCLEVQALPLSHLPTPASTPCIK